MTKFVVSHRLATADRRADITNAAGALEGVFDELAGFADVVHDTHANGDAPTRRMVHLDAEPTDVAAFTEQASREIIVEPVFLRSVHTAVPGGRAFSAAAVAAPAPGATANLNLTVVGGGKPIADALVVVLLNGAGGQTQAGGTTSADGTVAVAYDAQRYHPVAALIDPTSTYWGWWQANPTNGMTITIPALPMTGPLSWWHHLIGMDAYDENRGAGIHVGIVDTGVGPNTDVAHVNGVGSILNGVFTPGAKAALDSQDHGTHVSGIIGSRPGAGSGGYGGVAAGADISMVRVFPPKAQGGQASQGDIVQAIDELVLHQQADLVNLSLGDAQKSEIERDAIVHALQAGSLVFCSAGNGDGQPIMFPASYAQAIAVSAVGVTSAAVPGTVAAAGIPRGPGSSDKFTPSGIYLANFNDVGPSMNCTSTGVGIISTVPASGGDSAPYASMSGTSMAAPMACASLASWLGSDEAYKALPRDITRSMHAWQVFTAATHAIPLAHNFVGNGLLSAAP